jgi:hypothetical protein
LQFSSHWPARSAGVKLQSASASFPKIRCPDPSITGLLCLGRAVRRSFQARRIARARATERVPFQIPLRTLPSGAKPWFGPPVAACLETECTMRSECFSMYRRPGSYLRQPKHGESCPCEQSFKLMIQRSIAGSIGLGSGTY